MHGATMHGATMHGATIKILTYKFKFELKHNQLFLFTQQIHNTVYMHIIYLPLGKNLIKCRFSTVNSGMNGVRLC
jgi:hypothetical protein